MSYGKIKVIHDEKPFEEHNIVEFMQSDFIGGRHVSVAKTEHGNVVIMIENPESSGREPKQSMHLSNESFIAVLSTCILYVSAAGVELKDLIEKAMIGGSVNFTHSDNLKPPF